MKPTLVVFFIFSLLLIVSAQKRQTDRELEGLKGPVRTFTYEFPSPLQQDNRRFQWSKSLFDKKGRLIKISYIWNSERVIFREIDGFKTYKVLIIVDKIGDVLKLPPLKRGMELERIINSPWPEELKLQPIEKPEKFVRPDNRFDLKYVYEYDPQGRIKIGRQYFTNGKLAELKTLKYDEKGRIHEEIVNDGLALSKFVYKYDESGNLIEKSEERNFLVKKIEFEDFKEDLVDTKTITSYSEYKFDAHGNWIQRESTLHASEMVISSMMYYRTISYF